MKTELMNKLEINFNAMGIDLQHRRTCRTIARALSQVQDDLTKQILWNRFKKLQS